MGLPRLVVGLASAGGTFLGCPTCGSLSRKVPRTFLGCPTCGNFPGKIPIEVGLGRSPGNPGYM